MADLMIVLLGALLGVLGCTCQAAASSPEVTASSVQQLRYALADAHVSTVWISTDLQFTDANWPASAQVSIGAGRSIVVSGNRSEQRQWPLIDGNYLFKRIILGSNASLTFTKLFLFRIRLSMVSSFPGIMHITFDLPWGLSFCIVAVSLLPAPCALKLDIQAHTIFIQANGLMLCCLQAWIWWHRRMSHPQTQPELC